MSQKPIPISEQIRNRRNEAGLTQVTAARRLGVTGNTWARWEQGTAQPPIATLERIAITLRCILVIKLESHPKPPYRQDKLATFAPDRFQLVPPT